MKLISWNLAARSKFSNRQFAEVIANQPDVLCLQELSRNSVPVWRALLSENGYELRCNIDPDRTRGVGLGCRLPIKDTPTPMLPRSDAIIGASCGGTPVWCVHMPNGAKNGSLKPHCFEVLSSAAREHKGPLVVAGDFNGPRAELLDGTIITWGQTIKGNLRARHGLPKGAWDAAERSVFEGLPDAGLQDVFRSLRSDFHDPTWRSYRLDHVFTNLSARSVRHVEGSSDHKMVIVELIR